MKPPKQERLLLECLIRPFEGFKFGDPVSTMFDLAIRNWASRRLRCCVYEIIEPELQPRFGIFVPRKIARRSTAP